MKVFSSAATTTMSLLVTTAGALQMPSLLPATANKSRMHPKDDHHNYYPSVIPVDLQAPPRLSSWSRLSRDIVWGSPEGLEAIVEWPATDDARIAARSLTRKASDWFEESDDEKEWMYADVLAAMTKFSTFCQENLRNIRGYKVKLTVVHGSSATRCPSWHIDHVPVRWLQTLTGPGSMYVDPALNKDNLFLQRVVNGIKYGIESSIEAAEGNDSVNWKERLIDLSGIEPQQARTGQALLFVGNSWDTTAKPGKRGVRDGVVHRSPLNVPADQGRVLLTLDVSIQSLQPGVCQKACCANKGSSTLPK